MGGIKRYVREGKELKVIVITVSGQKTDAVQGFSSVFRNRAREGLAQLACFP